MLNITRKVLQWSFAHCATNTPNSVTFFCCHLIILCQWSLSTPPETIYMKLVNSITNLQPLKFVSALGNCQGFCQGKSVFSLMCVSKLLPSWNCLNSIHVNFWINYCKKVKKSSFLYTFWATLIIAIINNKRGKIRKNKVSVINR